MEALLLRDDLREPLAQAAKRDARSVNEIANDAIEHYLRETQRAKLDREIAAFMAMHAELRLTHLGEWVAIHNRQLVDHDQERAALYRRVRARYGHTPVLIREVCSQSEDLVWLRTPGTGRPLA
jgi:hypothetical protein